MQNHLSEGARIGLKPKKLHKIDTHLSEIFKMMKINKNENLPAVYLLDGIEMASNAAASYSAIHNILYINREIAIYKPENVLPKMKIFSFYKDDRSSYIHELYHWIDAESFRRKYGNVTAENYNDYVDFIKKKSKTRLDKLQKKGYNVVEVSNYAESQYREQKYYETYTEYRVDILLRSENNEINDDGRNAEIME